MARSWGSRSKAALDTVDSRLVEVHNEALKLMDHTVTEGRRSKEDQNKAFDENRSALRWPDGNHNVTNPDDLATATDSYPYPVELREIIALEKLMKDLSDSGHDNSSVVKDGLMANMRQAYLKGMMMGIAHMKGYTFRWGGDWSMDGVLKDSTFFDAPHIEVKD